MPSKYQQYMDLLQYETLDSTQSIENWERYLDGATKNFKYSFNEQLLINAQKPTATAIADYDTWTKRLGRVVKTGTAMYIPVIENGRPTVKNFFDITDTKEKGIPLHVPRWVFNQEHEQAVMEHIADHYAMPEILETGGDIGDALDTVIGKTAMDYLHEGIETIRTALEGSQVYDENSLDDAFIQEQAFEDVVFASAALIVHNRLGIRSELKDAYTGIIETHLSKFNTQQSINALGNAVSDISGECLRNIEAAVRAYDKEQKIDKERGENERIHPGSHERNDLLRTADRAGNGRNDRTDASRGHDFQQMGIPGQRGALVHDGADGRERPRNENAVPQHADGRTFETVDPVGHGADGLPKTAQQILSHADGDNRAAQALSGNRGTGQEPQGEHDGSHPQRPGEQGNGERQSPRPDSMGGQNEQLPSEGSRNDLQRPDLRIINGGKSQDEAPTDLGAFSMQKIPPMFVVDWDEVQYDFDLSQYEDRDMVAYNKDGVSFQVGKVGNLTYITTTTSITPMGDILGDNDIPNYIRQQMRAYRNGEMTAGQVREETLKRLESYKSQPVSAAVEQTAEAERLSETEQPPVLPIEYPKSISHSPLLKGWYEVLGQDEQLTFALARKFNEILFPLTPAAHLGRVERLFEKESALILQQSKLTDAAFEVLKSQIIEERVEKQISLGLGSMGNGTIFWDRLNENDDTNDYVSIAHVSDNGEISWRVDDKYFSDDTRAYFMGMVQDYANGIKNELELKPVETPTHNGKPLADNESIETIDGVDFVIKTVRGNQPTPVITNENTLEQQNFQTLLERFPEIASREYFYMRLEAEKGMMPLSLEWTGDNLLTISHSYIENNVVKYDPMIVMEVDNRAKTATAIEFQESKSNTHQFIDEDGIGYGVHGNGDEHKIDGLQGQLSNFVSEWFEKINDQGYAPNHAVLVAHKDIKDPSVYFNADRKPFNLAFMYEQKGTAIINRMDKTELTAEGSVGGMARIAYVDSFRDITYFEDNLPQTVVSVIENVKLLNEQKRQRETVKEAPPVQSPTYQGTPLWQDYQLISSQHSDHVLFYRLGDFYEVMGDKASAVADALDIAVTGRDVGLKQRIPMVGVPQHSLDGYVEALTQQGFRVAMRHGKDEIETRTRNMWHDIQTDEPQIDLQPPSHEPVSSNIKYDVDKIYAYVNSQGLDNRATNRLLDEIKQKINTVQFIAGIGRTPTAEEAADADLWLKERHPVLYKTLSEEKVETTPPKTTIQPSGIFATLPDRNLSADTQGKYSDTHFRIDKNGYDSSGRTDWDESTRSAYDKEVAEIFTNHGWVIQEPERSGSAPTAVKGKNHLYLHPQDFSGVCENTERETLYQAFQNANTFVCRTVDVYREIHDMTDEELLAKLNNERAEIESELLEAFTTKRSDLYVTSVGLFGVDGKIGKQHGVKRLAIEGQKSHNGIDNRTDGICAFFASDVFKSLVDSGKMVSSKTKNGLGYRTANEAELQKALDKQILLSDYEQAEIPQTEQVEQADIKDTDPVKIGDTVYFDNQQFTYRGNPSTKNITLLPVDVDVSDTQGVALKQTTYLLPYEEFIQELKEDERNAHLFSFVAPVENDVSESIPQPLEPHPPKPENFRMDSLDYASVAEGGPKAKFRKNVEAIRTLQAIEAEGRTATPVEQAVLAHYVGWGGIQEAFQFNNQLWREECNELKELLSPSEYEAARASVLTAYYTEPTIMTAMWDKIEELGGFNGYGNLLKSVNVLEPSMGVGNFFGTVPEHIGNNANLLGVEIDSISGRIAKHLYPNGEIQVKGFEKTAFKDNFFDVAIGNVPFSDSIKPVDWRYDKEQFLIHDYFFNKALDKIRPGGVVAFITSAGTLDKTDDKARIMMAEKAELLGAIRLPNTAFKANAGTEVVADIIFLQKRDEPLDHLRHQMPDWVESKVIREPGMNPATDRWQAEIKRNNYFINNPNMILGEYTEVSGRYGNTETVLPIEGTDLGEQLREAMGHISGVIPMRELDEVELDEETATKSISYDHTRDGFFDSADRWIDAKDSSFAVVEGDVYFRNNYRLNLVTESAITLDRIKAMVTLRDTLRNLIQAQVDDRPNVEIEQLQKSLNTKYDSFSKKYGLITSKGNAQAFDADDSYYLLSSLEHLNDELEFVGKSDIFTKRTIKPHIEITSVNTSSEALGVSIGYKGRVDLDYMVELTGFEKQKIINDLEGVIFLDARYHYDDNNIGVVETATEKYLPADEYLSGNVREKLAKARDLAEIDPRFTINITALEKAQPIDLEAHEIYVRLGTTWIDKTYIQQFMNEILEVPAAYKYQLNEDGSPRFSWETAKSAERDRITIQYSSLSNEWRVTNKNIISGENIKSDVEYGTERLNAYHILEQTLNLKDVIIKDKVMQPDNEGKLREVEVVNEEQTTLARQKQEDLKNAFRDWVFKDPVRREALVATYNEKFNAIRPREYDGSHITFSGMNAEIKLEEHQVNAVARVMYGGNTLLAHEVGAGKSFEMIAAAMESKRIGLCNKSLIAVPKHLTGQMASEFLRLYPNANILVATDKTFELKNRKKFCAKIVTGNYDAIIMGHTQFEMIQLSKENQEKYFREQFDLLVEAIAEAKAADSGYFTVKQMENTKNKVKAKLDSLYKDDRKDDVITFEQLGIEKLFYDESQNVKNLHLYTKMRNVAGISQTESQKAADMFMKARYLDEETDGKGVIMASGTPISNSLTEMYTVQRYLQFNKLKEMGLEHFDQWASIFTEPTSDMELAVEGSGYRLRTRCARFQNLPELMNTFFEVADIKTAESLNLPRPEANFHTVSCEPSELQREMIQALSERADDVRNRRVKPNIDNMLAITTDGRKLGLDQRVINPNLPDEPTSKINHATENIFNIWQNTKEDRLTQVVFCDLSTPTAKNKNEHGFSVYEDVRQKLIDKGVPKNEIAFVHDYNTDKQKQQLFAKVRAGSIRVVFGSTEKMGAGTNIQDKLVALHHLDCPWRPSDLQQREGRILRRGNQNKTIDIYKYVTKDTFDAYLYQTIEKKQQFISQIMTEKSPMRTVDDVDQSVLDYAEIKALCVGNPKIKEKMDLEQDLKKLNALQSQHKKNLYRMESALMKKYPMQITAKEQNIENYTADERRLAANTEPVSEGISTMVIDGKPFTERVKAGETIKEACKIITTTEGVKIGTYRGFDMHLSFDKFSQDHVLTLKGDMPYPIKLEGNFSTQGVVTRIDNMLEKIPQYIEDEKRGLQDTINQMETARIEVEKPFPFVDELKEKTARVTQLNVELSLDAIKSQKAELGENENAEDDIEQPEHEELADHDVENDMDNDLGHDSEQTPAEIFASAFNNLGAETIQETRQHSEAIGETFEIGDNGGKGAFVNSDIYVESSVEKTSGRADAPLPKTSERQTPQTQTHSNNVIPLHLQPTLKPSQHLPKTNEPKKRSYDAR